MFFVMTMLIGCMNQASFEEKKWDNMCARAFECLSESERNGLEFISGINFRDDVGECRQEYDEEYKADFEPDEECKFDAEEANSCITRLYEAECDEFFDVYLSSDCQDVCD